MSLNNKILTGIFKLRTQQPLYNIKQFKPLKHYLVQNKTFLTNSKWQTEKTVTIGWLYKALPDYHRQDDLAKEIGKIAKIDTDTFILVPTRSTITSTNGKRIIYNSLKIESTKENAEKVQEAITKALFGNRENFIITKNMQFIPNKPTQFITQDQLTQYAICQNRYCTEITHKRITNMTNLDTPIKKTNGETTTLRQHLLQIKIPQSTKPLLNAVEQSNNNSVLFIFNHNHKNLIEEYIKSMRDTLSKEIEIEGLQSTYPQTDPKPSKDQFDSSPYETLLMEANPQEEFETLDFPEITQTPRTPPITPQLPTNHDQPNNKTFVSAWSKPLQQQTQHISIEQLERCLKETKATSEQTKIQQKELEETKNLLNSSNKLVYQVSQRVQEMSNQMTMITQTISGLVQSVNTIAQFMNTHNYTIESPQSGQTPIQIIPTPQNISQQHQNEEHNNTNTTPTERSPQLQEGYQT